MGHHNIHVQLHWCTLTILAKLTNLWYHAQANCIVPQFVLACCGATLTEIVICLICIYLMYETAAIWFCCVVLCAWCLAVSSVLSHSSQRKRSVVLLCFLLMFLLASARKSLGSIVCLTHSLTYTKGLYMYTGRFMVCSFLFFLTVM